MCVILIKILRIKVKISDAEGINSNHLFINQLGIETVWSLSIRFWVDRKGQKITNPVVVCLNLVSCKLEGKHASLVKYKFGKFNHDKETFEMGAEDSVI